MSHPFEDSFMMPQLFDYEPIHNGRPMAGKTLIRELERGLGRYWRTMNNRRLTRRSVRNWMPLSNAASAKFRPDYWIESSGILHP